MTVRGAPLREPLKLAPIRHLASQRRSLSFDAYREPAHTWATVTPMVLDRFPKGDREEAIRDAVMLACERAGLPAPQRDAVYAGKHSAIEGCPPARPGADEPPWTRWRVPRSMAKRPLVHIAIEFCEPVAGPIMLGAGRFNGMGLCRQMGGQP